MVAVTLFKKKKKLHGEKSVAIKIKQPNFASTQMHKPKGKGGTSENGLGVGLFLWNAWALYDGNRHRHSLKVTYLNVAPVWSQ